MPSRTFRFIRSAMGASAEPLWHRIVWRGYVNAKSQEEQDENETLRKYHNRVYHRLLNNESISGYFVDVKRRKPVVRGDLGWRLFASYQREVISMDQRRIDSLRDLGDRIAPLMRDRHRRLLTLERADSRGRLTDVLYRLSKDAITRDHKEPLITFDQLVSDVFPHDTAYSDWREVKYLLLFRIYEQLFDELKDDPGYANTEDEEQEVVS
jgi:CRISPR-associated protein Cst1